MSSRFSGFLTPPPGSDPYERRLRQKVKAGWNPEQDPDIVNEINQGVSSWSTKKAKSNDNIIHPMA